MLPFSRLFYSIDPHSCSFGFNSLCCFPFPSRMPPKMKSSVSTALWPRLVGEKTTNIFRLSLSIDPNPRRPLSCRCAGFFLWVCCVSTNLFLSPFAKLERKKNLFVRNHLTVYTLLLPDAGSSHQGESLAEHVQYV